jgi:hypothetical protein
VHKPNDRGAGRLTEHGALLAGGKTAYRNMKVVGNTFMAPDVMIGREGQPYVSKNAFINVGAVDGLLITGNRMTRSVASTDNMSLDMTFYSNKNVEIGNDNMCFAAGRSVACKTSNDSKPLIENMSDGATRTSMAVPMHDSSAREYGTRPHVLFIVADDLGFADLGYTGSDIRTPRIDRLAKEGTIFEVSLPSIATVSAKRSPICNVRGVHSTTM